MITQALRYAHQLDSWLDRRIGPPYRGLLAAGLTIELIRQLHELLHARHELVLLHILPVLLDAALLLHTADSLYEHWERRLARIAQRRTPEA